MTITLPEKGTHPRIPCCVCGGKPTHRVRELRPGAKGRYSQSFWSSYYLCFSCLALANGVGALVGVEDRLSAQYNYVIALAKTAAWLGHLAAAGGSADAQRGATP